MALHLASSAPALPLSHLLLLLCCSAYSSPHPLATYSACFIAVPFHTCLPFAALFILPVALRNLTHCRVSRRGGISLSLSSSSSLSLSCLPKLLMSRKYLRVVQILCTSWQRALCVAGTNTATTTTSNATCQHGWRSTLVAGAGSLMVSRVSGLELRLSTACEFRVL